MMTADLFEDIAARAGGIPLETAARVTRATVAALASLVPHVDAEALAARLPRNLRTAPALGQGELFHVVARRARVRLPIAVEVGQIACAVLADRLTPEERERIARHLPAELRWRFEPSAPAPAPATTPDRAQEESVVLAENPHGARKISSGHREIDELGANTLAGGRPGSHRPLSG